MTEHSPLVLKYSDWPTADQAAWDDLFNKADFFGDDGPVLHWSLGTRKKHSQAYGQWLSFLKRTQPDALNNSPALRATKERIRAYLRECEARLKPKSTLGLIGSLYDVLRLFDPNLDWTWLQVCANRLRANTPCGDLPSKIPISAQKIFSWSLTRLAAIRAQATASTIRDAIHFRQALMIGFLAARPVRRRALLAMTVNEHLEVSGNVYMVHFSGADMKDGKARSFPLPDPLTSYMSAYLTVFRPMLLQSCLSDGLWISQFGKPIKADGFSRELPKVTSKHLGVSLRPHVFRHIAATSIAEVVPEHVGIIRDLLGHATLDMAERHYNRASGVSACNMLQNLITKISREAAKPQRLILQIQPSKTLPEE